jgi:hypothetical protein
VPLSNDTLGDILAVVDRLTLPHKTAVLIEHDDGTPDKQWVDHDALLVQLRNSIRSSTGAHPGAGGLASERSVIDSDALEQYDAICGQILGLYAEVTDARPFRLPESNLRSWFVGFKRQVEARKIASELVEAKYRKLNRIAASIEGKLNPPTVLEITAPCPRCSESHARDDAGVYRRAILVESRISEYKSLDYTRARCMACQATWIHGRGMRQLRYEIDHAEQGAGAVQLDAEVLFSTDEGARKNV